MTTHALVGVHGIYTGSYNWCDRLRAYAKVNYPSVDVREYDFGFITATHMYLDGLCPWFAKGMCRKFSDWFARKMMSYPVGMPYSFVAHSFGTWLLTETLWRHKEIQPSSVILFGSVLSSHFERTRWPEIIKRDQIDRLHVFWSPKDDVIERYSRSFFGVTPFGHLGCRGFVGDYNRDIVRQYETAETHSGYFYPQNRDKYFNQAIIQCTE